MTRGALDRPLAHQSGAGREFCIGFSVLYQSVHRFESPYSERKSLALNRILQQTRNNGWYLLLDKVPCFCLIFGFMSACHIEKALLIDVYIVYPAGNVQIVVVYCIPDFALVDLVPGPIWELGLRITGPAATTRLVRANLWDWRQTRGKLDRVHSYHRLLTEQL